jgi:PKD-like domain/Secretion system C-terminal sorting domain
LGTFGKIFCMRKMRLGALVSAVFVLLISNKSFSQVVSGNDFRKADINVTELAKYYKEHPLPLVRIMPIEEEEEDLERPKHKAPPSSEVHLLNRTPKAVQDEYDYRHEPLLPVSPAPNDTFLSTTSPGIAIPPDTHGAVDSQYCVTAINTNIHIQSRTGSPDYLNISLDGFWASVLPATTGTFDPRIHYDPYKKRWILVTAAVTNGTTKTNSTILIGVSVTSDPTGDWHLYSYAVDPTGASWLDFPNVGFNNKWIVVTGNMFAGASGAVVYTFDYASLLAGTFVTPTKITKSSSFAICPALTYSPTEPSMFCVETWNPGSGQLRLWKITGPVGTPTMTSVGYPATTQHWHGSGGGGDFGPQSGITNKIDLGDDRITSCVFRNGKLWTAHNAFLPSPGTANRCSIMWWQTDTLAVPIQVGLVNDPTASKFYAYPSITANSLDDALIGMGTFSTGYHPSAAYALHLHTDALDSIHPAHIFRHGQGTYYTTFGGSKNRWGDYSATSIDPRNDVDFWTIQESSIVGTSANWDTWWANVQICAKPGEPTMDFVGTPPCPGDTVSFSILPIAGATSYEWHVSGAGWSGSSTTTSITLTAGTGVGTVAVLAYNACGQGESHIFSITPMPLFTTAPVINTLIPACTGTAIAAYTTSVTGATSYDWKALGVGWSGTSTSITLNASVGSGTGYIICKAINACGTSPADTLIVNPGSPVSNFSAASHSVLVGVNDLITFTGTAPVGTIFSWSFAGGTATPGTGVGPHTVSWPTVGSKTVILGLNNDGCLSTHIDTVIVHDATGFQQVNNPNLALNIVPNPNDGSFNIVFSKPVNKPITVQLADMQGRVVYTNEFNGSASQLAVVTDHLAAGIYVVSIHIDGDIINEKITIKR